MNKMINNMNNMMMLNQNNVNQNNKQIVLDLINQNIQMENQIMINNNKIKNIIENPNFNIENNQINDLYNNLYDIEFFPGEIGDKINVIFEEGNTKIIKINVVAPVNATMKQLLEVFYIKLQIYGKSYSKKIKKLNEYYFLFKNMKIPLDEKKTIYYYGLRNEMENITFWD